MSRLVASTVYTLAALVFYLFSGMAEGFVSPRTLSMLVFVAALGHAIFTALRLGRRICDKGVRLYLSDVGVFTGTAALAIAIKFGFDLDERRVAETMRQGDQIIAEIIEIKASSGNCPANIAVLEKAGVVMPEPALNASKFQYHSDGSDTCSISFESVTFTLCIRHWNEPEWYCTD